MSAPRDERGLATGIHTTTCSGLRLLLLRASWLALVLLALVPASASFVLLLGDRSLEFLLRAGVFAIDPKIVSGLEILGLTQDVLVHADLAFRLSGMGLFTITAGVIFIRKSDDWMTALVSFTLIGMATTWFAPLGVLAPGSLLTRVAELVGNAQPFETELGRSLTGLSVMMVLYLFPDGRFVPRWSRWAAAILVVEVVLWNALPGSVFDPTTWPGLLEGGIDAVIVGSGLLAQAYRFLAVSGPAERQRTKLVVAAMATISLIPPLLFIVNPGLGAGLTDLTLVTPRVEALYNLILLVILGVAMFLLPLSLAISVLRYRLWDIDVLINRTLVYGALTGILGLAYFGILAAVSAVADQSYITAGAATLLIAVLFQPLRARLQDVIDKQFYRRRYNATRTLYAFSTRLREEIDLATLSSELLGVVEETMLPTGVSLWMVPTAEERGDTIRMERVAFSVAGGKERVRGPDFEEIEIDSESLDTLKKVGEPLELDSPTVRSRALVRFRDVYVKLAVPLVAQGELIGILNLGPRRSETDYSSDDRRLLDNLSDHAAAALRVALLVRAHEADLRSKERIENEMRVAQHIQTRLIPKELPRIEGWEVYSHYHPAREVGGDFYDFIALPDGRLAMVTGDVTGKGVPAALVMATTRTILRSEAPRFMDPAQILERTNEQLIEDIPEQMFVTCLCAILDPRTGRLVFANAGHNVPYLRTGDDVREVKATGMPLGLMSGMRYEQRETTLVPGSILVLHSDGLSEARNLDKEMFGLARMRDSIAGCNQPGNVIEQLIADLRAFTGDDWDQDDDITLAVVHRLPLDDRRERELEPSEGAGLDEVLTAPTH